jgi:tRNA threonylcarbamoyladenosine modification (KEOPS) complex  Pcc1 subunit
VRASHDWHATIRITRPAASDAERVAEALSPEVSREVPRARAELVRIEPESVELRIIAADTSACRAALNTYLAWIGLVLSTEQAAAGRPAPSEARE